MAKIKDEDVDILRERASIVDIVSGYTNLKKSGGKTFKGLCPFHSEKTPSFTVDAVKGLYFCHGCQEGGDLYHFVEKVENLSFPEAVEWIARRTGYDLRYEESRPGEQRLAGLKERLLHANRVAAEFFHDCLMTAPEASDARRYLGGRRFDREVAKRWQLGYAPGRGALQRHLLAKGFTFEELGAADLIRRSERDGSYYDTFYERITFPTWDRNGQVVGFGARALGDQQPKYLNTSETPLFAKSRLMYGLHRARQSIQNGAAVVVEGYTDVIALHEAGITEAVATNGVALGDTHFELLKRYTERVILMLDADAAGKGATERAFDIHHRTGVEVLVAPLAPGRDPADVVTEKGSDALRAAIATAQPLMKFKLEEAIARAPLDTPEARSRAVRDAARVLSWQRDPIARRDYIFMAADRIGVEPATIELALQDEMRAVEAAARTTKTYEDRRLPGQVKVENETLQLLIIDPERAALWIDQLVERDFTSAARREVFRAASRALAAGRAPADAQITADMSPEARSLFTQLTVGAEKQDDSASDRMRELFVRLRLFRLEREIRARRDTLQDVNPKDDADNHDALFTELVGLEAERRDLRRQLQGAV